jgi:hypothetical protein
MSQNVVEMKPKRNVSSSRGGSRTTVSCAFRSCKLRFTLPDDKDRLTRHLLEDHGHPPKKGA